jgi:hypothetical protein
MPAIPCPSRGAKYLAAALLITANAMASGTDTDWMFTVSLGSRPIGTHRFTLQDDDAGARRLVSDARFDVKILGITAYRYRHHAEERWSGDCLASLVASTDDDGEVTTVEGAAAASAFTVVARARDKPVRADATGCLMSFAYWNPQALARQSRLVDPGTGRIEAVEVQPLAATTLAMQGRRVAVTGLRLNGLKHPIDLWYSDGHWVGLDTTVDGGRKLAYRLQ